MLSEAALLHRQFFACKVTMTGERKAYTVRFFATEDRAISNEHLFVTHVASQDEARDRCLLRHPAAVIIEVYEGDIGNNGHKSYFHRI